MGHVVTADGLRPDEPNVHAIVHMPPPDGKPALRRLLGLVKYLAQYIPHGSDITQPLWSFLKEDVQRQWIPEHEADLQKIREVLTSQPLFPFYDVKKTVTIPYVYGKHCEIQSDHCPLEVVFKKPLGKVPPRLQRILLQLQRYSRCVTYTLGRLLFLADTLSRAYPQDTTESNLMDEEMEVMVHELVPDKPVRRQFRTRLSKRYSVLFVKDGLNIEACSPLKFAHFGIAKKRSMKQRDCYLEMTPL